MVNFIMSPPHRYFDMVLCFWNTILLLAAPHLLFPWCKWFHRTQPVNFLNPNMHLHSIIACCTTMINVVVLPKVKRCLKLCMSYGVVNPRPAGVWLVTRPAGGGGGQRAPPEISQTTGPISKFQTLFDSPVRELPVQGQIFDPEVTDDVTGQIKVRIFDFSGLTTSTSKISMLSANKANESAWIVSLTSVSIISCALWP